MKVLVATDAGQGNAPDDYCWTLEGELVTPVVAECGRPERCGCGRGFPGFGSARATTTAMVVDLEHVGAAELEVAVADYLSRSGWFDGLGDGEQGALVRRHVDAIGEVCAAFPAGTIVQRHGAFVTQRQRWAA